MRTIQVGEIVILTPEYELQSIGSRALTAEVTGERSRSPEFVAYAVRMAGTDTDGTLEFTPQRTLLRLPESTIRVSVDLA